MGPPDSLLRPPFVGRRAELRALRSVADSVATTSDARSVFLLGEAGVGKSRLVEEFLASLDPDWTTCVVVCDPHDPPYGPVLALLDQLDPAVAAAEESARPESLANVTNRVAELVALTTQSHPVVVVVENADDAGDSTIDALTQAVILLGRASRVLLLVTWRTGAFTSATEERRAQLSKLQRELSSSTIVVHGLSEHEVVALLDSIGDQPAPQRSAELLIERSDGNPLHLIHSARSADVPGIGVAGSEQDFDHLIAGVADRLSSADQWMIAYSTLIAPQIDGSGLAAAAGADRADAESALERARDAGVLHTTPRGYAFTHPLLRDYFSESLGRYGIEVEEAHALIAEHLAREAGEAPGARQISRIARHLVDAQMRADPDLLARFAGPAARIAQESGEWLTAARLFDLATRATPPASDSRFDALVGGGIAYARSGNPERSVALFRDAEEIARRLDDDDRIVDVLRHRLQLLAAHLRDRERAAEPAEVLSEALHSTKVSPGAEATARSTLATSYFERGRNEDALHQANLAVRAAGQSDDDEAVGHARFALGLAELGELQPQRSLDDFRGSFEAFARANHPWYRTWPTGRIPLTLWMLGRLDDADHESTQASLNALSAHNWGGHEFAMAARAGVRAARGEFDEAENDVYDALLAHRVSRYAWPPRLALPVLAYIRSCRGDDAGADEVVNRYRSLVGQSASWDLEVLVLLLRGEQARVHRMRRDDPRRANRRWSPSVMTLGPLTLASEAAVLLGDQDACRDNVQQLQIAAQAGAELPLGWITSLSRGTGAAATVIQDWDLAEHSLRLAIERSEKERARPELARSYLDFAELLRARDGASSARVAMEHVEQAERLFAELGMLRHVRWAQTLATRLGEQPPKTVPTKSDDSSPLTR
ncbi:MAG: AAA family ATPase, partial [Dehalococcoidia bacterium]|nr:AAA family ATPase [Dehalococcoidia bacterium]